MGKAKASSGHLNLSESDRAHELPSIFDVASESSQDHHAAVEWAKAFIGQDWAHVEQLLLTVDVNALFDLVLLSIDTASPNHGWIAIVWAIVWSKRADLFT